MAPLQAGRILSEAPSSARPTPIPPTPSHRESTPKSAFTEADYVLIVKLYCDYGDMYLEKGGKTKFWEWISAIAETKLGKPVKGPRQIVMIRLLGEYNKKILIEKTLSGKPVPQTDLNDALSNWKTNWVDRELSEKEESKEAREAAKMDKELATALQGSILKTFSGKSNFESIKKAIIGGEHEEEEEKDQVVVNANVSGDGLANGKENDIQKTGEKVAPKRKTAMEKEKDIRDKRRRISEREKIVTTDSTSSPVAKNLDALSIMHDTLQVVKDIGGIFKGQAASKLHEDSSEKRIAKLEEQIGGLFEFMQGLKKVTEDKTS